MAVKVSLTGVKRTGELKEFTREYWTKATLFRKSKHFRTVTYLNEKCILKNGESIYLPLEIEKLETIYI